MKHTLGLNGVQKLTALVEAAVTPDRRGGVSRRLRAAPCSPWWGLGLNNRANRAPVPSTPEQGNTLQVQLTDIQRASQEQERLMRFHSLPVYECFMAFLYQQHHAVSDYQPIISQVKHCNACHITGAT
jgi:hypothetical protein